MKIESIKFLFGIIFISALSCSGPKEKKTVTQIDKKYEYIRYSEPEDPNSVNIETWNGVPASLQGSYVSIDERYHRSVPPVVENQKNWTGTAWKGERINAQIALWSSADMGNITFEINTLKNAKGNTINASNIRTRFVRFLLTDEFAGGCGYRKKEDFAVALVADVIDEVDTLRMKEKTTRPVWVTIDVPEDAQEGMYKGKINIRAEKGEQLEFDVSLEVQNHTLPSPKEWRYHLDLWQNPYAVARYHNVQPWSSAHFKYLKPLMEMLANAGQKCVTTSIINRPWNGQTEDPFDSMIQWTRKTDGSWSYDYSIFDKWVEFAQKCGISKQINCYTMIPWYEMGFTYFDEAKQEIDTLITKPGTKEYVNHWSPFLKDFTKHLKNKKWFEKTTLAMDERPVELMQDVIKIVKDNSPEFKISLAGGYHEEIENDIYDMCVASRHRIPDIVREKREAQGKPTTYYTCCTEPYPNNFSFSPPAEGVWQGWHAAARNYDGYLRWAYNSWVKEPLLDSRFTAWPAGDTSLVYPESRTSIRFERIREGIQDYEKIQILKEKLRKTGNKELLNQLNVELKTFEISNLSGTNAGKMINQGKKLINQISKKI